MGLLKDFDKIEKCIGEIDATKAEAYFPQDEENIKGEIQRTVGFSELNRQVQVQLRTWLADAGEEVLANWRAEKGVDDVDTLSLEERMGLLNHYMNRLPRARRHCLTAVEGFARVLPDGDLLTCRARQSLGLIMAANDEREEALVHLQAGFRG